MSLDPAGLAATLDALMRSPGSTAADCAARWASAWAGYAGSVAPPAVGVGAAEAALTAALTAAFATPSAVAAMDDAFTAAGAALGVGMLPAFAAVPPPGPVGFATVLATPYAATSAEAAGRIADAIHAWMQTGSATPSVGGPVAPWS